MLNYYGPNFIYRRPRSVSELLREGAAETPDFTRYPPMAKQESNSDAAEWDAWIAGLRR